MADSNSAQSTQAGPSKGKSRGDPNQPTKERSLRGILYIPKPRQGPEPQECDERIEYWSEKELEGLVYRRLPVAQALGLPLAIWHSEREDIGMVNSIQNEMFSGLLADYDVQRIKEDIERSGVAKLAERKVTGGCFLIRYDGKPLKPQFLQLFRIYFETHLPGVGGIPGEPLRSMSQLEDLWARYGPWLTPESFQGFRRDFIDRQNDGGRNWYDMQEDPVVPEVAVHDTKTGQRRGTW